MTCGMCAGRPEGVRDGCQVAKWGILVDRSARLSVEADELNFGHAESEMPVRHEDGDTEQEGEMLEVRKYLGAVSMWMAVKTIGRDESTQSMWCWKSLGSKPHWLYVLGSYFSSLRPSVWSEK